MARRWIDRTVAAALVSLVASAALAAGASGERTRRPHRSPRKTIPTQVVKRGKVVVVRGVTQPQPQLTDRQGRHWMLTGKWRAELARLHGHGVKVWGQPGKRKQMMPTLEVSRYEIIDVGGGRKPQVGQLAEDHKHRLQLRQKSRTLRVKAKSAMRRKLRKRIGCKVWLAGTLSGTAIRVSKYGWLTCKKAPIKPKDDSEKKRP